MAERTRAPLVELGKLRAVVEHDQLGADVVQRLAVVQQPEQLCVDLVTRRVVESVEVHHAISTIARPSTSPRSSASHASLICCSLKRRLTSRSSGSFPDWNHCTYIG